MDKYILAIESSCDETSVSIIKNGCEEISTVVLSQMDIHANFGGVVPEIASRNHVKNITLVIEEALKKANMTMNDIDAVAVTYGPGLIGSLLVGLIAAKTLAYAYNKPLVPVHHIAGHIYANNLVKPLEFPLISLVVSGGHTDLIYMKEDYSFERLGGTLDDAVGEAYDKVARVIDLPYPGGPNIDKLAKEGVASYTLPRPLDDDSFNFSFSGKKTAVINYIHTLAQRGEEVPVKDICASFQHIAVEELATKTIAACKKYKQNKLVLAGGVSANKQLRERLQELGKENNIKVYLPEFEYCTDNAAMIGASAYYSYIAGEDIADMNLAPAPGLSL